MSSAAFLQRLKNRNKRHRKSYTGWLVSTGQTKCHYCGKECGWKITADHKKPRSKGGYDRRTNILPACGSCNSAKGSMDYAEFVRPPHRQEGE